MVVAGCSLRSEDLIGLAHLLVYAGHSDLASRLLHADKDALPTFPLDLEERRAILAALPDSPEGLVSLRDSLLREQIAPSDANGASNASGLVRSAEARGAG